MLELDMKEILFRGKVKYNGYHLFSGTWLDGFYFYDHLSDAHYIKYADIDNYSNINRIIDVEVVAETVGQYTGLKDEKDNKVFEGDIININVKRGSSSYSNYGKKRNINHGVFKLNVVVYFDECTAKYKLKVANKAELTSLEAPRGREIFRQRVSFQSDFDMLKYYPRKIDFKIVGNIHDNPELVGE